MMRHSVLVMLGALVLAACSTLTATPPAEPPAAAPTEGHLPNVDWLAYEDPAGFSIQHPLTWQRFDSEGYPVVFVLPAAPGTNLIEKRMEINVRGTAGDCRQSTYGAETTGAGPEHITVNGIDFLHQTGSGIAAGNIYDWRSYSTTRASACITITFVLHASSSGVYSTEPPAFDEAAESQVFDALLNTFQFGQ